MNTVKRLSRFLILLVAAVLTLGIYFAAPASASRVTVHTKFDVRVKVSTVNWGGTDSNIYFRIYYVDGKKDEKKLDKSGYNDFERGDNDTYTVAIDRPYYSVKGFSIYNSGSDAMCIDEVEVKVRNNVPATLYVKNADGSDTGTQKKVKRTPNGTWVEKSEYRFDIDQNNNTERSQRQVQSGSSLAYRNFTNAFSKTAYLTADSKGNANVTWTPRVQDLIYNEYNPYEYEYYPSLSYKVFAAGQNGWTEAKNLLAQFGESRSTFKYAADNSDIPATVGFYYDQAKIYQMMCASNYYALRVDVTINYPSECSSSDHSKTVSYYICRKQFEIGTPEILNNPAPFKAMQGNIVLSSYFNSSSKNVELRIKVKSGTAYSNYDSDAVARTMKADSVRLYYGGGNSDYLTGTLSYKSNTPGYVYLTFPIKAGIDDSQGMHLVMKGVKATWKTGVTYDLYCTEAFTFDNQNQPHDRKIDGLNGGAGETLGNRAYYASMTSYKIDNVLPEIELNEKGATGLSGKWQQCATLVTTPSDVHLFPLGGNVSEGYFRMELLSNGSPIDFYRLDGTRRSKITGTSGLLVPTKPGRETTVTLANGQEVRNLTVRLTARDLAGNQYTKTVSGLNLDTKPPQVGVNTAAQPQAADGSRTMRFRFIIQELSGTGRVNYCFVPDGEGVPSETEGKQTSGTIASFIGEWGFIQQSDISGSTVVMKLQKGERFEGRLIYYAVDEAGNRSQTYTVPVSVNNLAAECKVTVEDYDHPLPEYQITFTPEKDCKVYYRYATPTANGDYFRRPYVTYDAAANPGAYAVEQVSGAASVVAKLNGQHILEYKVVNEKSGNVAYFEGGLGIALTFDNTPPAVDISQITAGLSIPAHTFTLTASDISGIVSASYTVKTADGKTTVKSGDLAITEGADTLYAVLGSAELGLGNGSYVITLTATDRNGQTSTMDSQPFSIRTAAPTAAATVNGSAPDEVVIVDDSATYTVDLSVTDTFAGAASGHGVFWRVSGDGTHFSEWKKLADLTPGSGTLTADAQLNTPLALNEGMNMVYLQLLCAENEKNLLRDVSTDSILSLEPLTLLLDVTAPAARWSYTCGRNNEALTGTLTVSDDMTAIPAVTCDNDEVTMTHPVDSEGVEDSNVYLVTYRVPEGGSPVEKFTITVTDDSGNQTTREVRTDRLDVTPPTIEIGVEPITYGSRKDAEIYVTVMADEDLGAVNFSYAPEAARGFAELEQQEEGFYRITLRGYTGSVTMTVTAADDLGNAAVPASTTVEVAVGTIEEPKIVSAPAYAQDSAPAVLEFSVPAFAFMKKADWDAAVVYAPEEQQTGYTYDADGHKELTVYTGTTTYVDVDGEVENVEEGEKEKEAATTYTTSTRPETEADRVLALLEAELRTNDTHPLTGGCVLKLSTEDLEYIKEHGESERSFTIWVVDEFGNAKEFTIRPETLFGKEYNVYLGMEQITTVGDVTTADNQPDALVTGKHVADPSDANDKEIVYNARVVVEPYTFFHVDDTTGVVSQYRIDYAAEEATVIDEEGNSHRVNIIYTDDYYYDIVGAYTIGEDTELTMTYAPVDLFPFSLLTEEDARIGDWTYNNSLSAEWDSSTIDEWDPEDYDDKESLLWHLPPERPIPRSIMPYDRILFEVDNPLVDPDDPTLGRGRDNVSSARLTIGLTSDSGTHYINDPCTMLYYREKYQFEGGLLDSPGDGNDGEIIFTEVPFYGYDFACSVSPTTRRDIIYDQNIEDRTGDIWMNKTLTINCPIITAEPEIGYSLHQPRLTTKVVLTAGADGLGAELKTFKLLRKDGTTWTKAAEWTPETGVTSASIDCEILEDGTYCLYAENKYGLSTCTEEIQVTIVRVGEIKDTEFAVKIADADAAPDANGEYRAPNEAYVDSVKAEIDVTAGAERGLRVLDGKTEAELLPEEPSYTFHLTDAYGYTRDVTVHYAKFDIRQPALDYALSNTNKTNQPITVTVTATDAESGIKDGYPTLTGPGGVADIIALTDQNNGTWTGTIERSGSYLLRAVDNMGNKKQVSFTVTNIDTVPPAATVTRNIPDDVWTQENVVATLSFDKPNVTITKAEGTNNSFTLDRSARTLTFTGNDTVTVDFRDDYGNTNQEVVIVKNIYSEPPQLAPVVTPAADKLSVQVSFEMAKDTNGAPVDVFHKLGDLTVIHNGVAYAAAETVTDEATGTTTEKKAVFLLRENGTYSFTAVDKVGLMQFIKLEVKGIDRSAPVVSAVSWSYTYLDRSGAEKSVTYDLDTVLNGADRGVGYRIANDIYERTNGNVTVTVETDKPTAIIGSYRGREGGDGAASPTPTALDYAQSGEYVFDMETAAGAAADPEYWSTEHKLIYHENGLYIFNMEKENGLSTHYGVDVEIIDKTPPTITLRNAAYLMFIEGRDKGSIRAMLTDYAAEDVFLDVKTDLTADVTVDFGGLDVDKLENNKFDKSSPFTVSYTVKDAAGNETTVTRTVVLVGINDVLVTVNGILPDSNMMAEARTGSVELKLINFSGIAYAAYAPGMYTFGQMKSMGTLLPQDGIYFHANNLAEGWYTFFIQTETRDYFNIYVFVG